MFELLTDPLSPECVAVEEKLEGTEFYKPVYLAEFEREER